MEIQILAFKEDGTKQYTFIENTPEGFTSLIGGNFALVSLYELIPYKIVVVFNRQAIIDGKDKALWIGTEWVHGTAIMTKMDGDKFVSLNEEDKNIIEEWLETKKL